MVVQTLRAQHLRKLAFMPRTFLEFCPFVLKPDLYLVLVQPKVLKNKDDESKVGILAMFVRLYKKERY